MRRLLRVGTSVAGGLLVLVAILAVLFAQVPILGGWRAYSVLSGSMEPAVPTGSLIITKHVDSLEDVREGQIITFAQPGYENQFITHRVVGNDGLGVQTKGDANPVVDDWNVAYGRIVGVYQFHMPGVGYVSAFLKTPWGVGLFIVIPVLVIVVAEMRAIIDVLVEQKVKRILRVWRKRRKSSQYLARHLDAAGRREESYGYWRPGVVMLALLSLAALGSVVRPAWALFTSPKVGYVLGTMKASLVTPTPTPTPVVTPSPTPTLTPTPTPTPIVDECGELHVSENFSNRETGAGSENRNKLSIHRKCEIVNETHVDVENTVEIEANTGGNSQVGNTSGGSSTSGDVKIDIDFSVKTGQ